LQAPIAILCALDWELAHAQAGLGSVGEAPVVLAVCGVGMVSAAAQTQAVISRSMPRAVLNYGCAGAHRAELLLGDIVVGTRVVAYDSVRETPDGESRYGGMFYLEGVEQRHVSALVADDELLGAARRVAEAHVDRHEQWPAELGWPEGVAHRGPRVAFGTVASADRWNRSPGSIGRIAEMHDSLCEDMEAAAIGLVCASNGVPFLTIKDISNNELLRATQGGAALMDELGIDQVARRAAAFTLEVVRELIQGRENRQV
jgi:adenosylhomocysteine nucleosidase